MERGVFVDHSLINRWAIRFLPLLEKVFRKHKRPVGCPACRQASQAHGRCRAVAQAAFVWCKWLAFCTVHGIDWIAAAPDKVRAFAGTVSARKPGAASAVSPVTLRRYWRILNDLYAYAVLTQLVERYASGEHSLTVERLQGVQDARYCSCAEHRKTSTAQRCSIAILGRKRL